MATETLNQKIGEEEKQIFYQYSEKEKVVVNEVFNRFTACATERNQSFEYFDGRTLTEYIDDNVKSFVTNVFERPDIEDWQARIHDPFTRNKVIAILGKVAAALPVCEFIAVGTEDFRREQMLGDLVQYADRMDDNEELMFYALLEALVKGTVIGYEGYEEKTKKVRDVKRFDSGDVLELEEGEVKIRKLVGYLVPLEDFYPSSVGIRKIQDMPYCFWRSVMPISQFRMKFSQYFKAQYVQPYATLGKDEERPFYYDYVSEGLNEGEVEVIRYYNQDTDEYVIIANGIWLNPLPGDEVSPLPFNHKQLPFWKAIYEPFGADFFYGKALPDKLKPMQEVIDVLHNMLLDQSFLSIFPPILVGGIDEIEDDILRPGRRIPVDDVNAYKELQISPPKAFHQYILEYTKRILEETSVDPVQQGIAGVGERVTATEIERAAQGVALVLGLFVNFVKWGVRDKARLRAKNVFQFYTAPLIERVLGEGGAEEYKKAFNVFKIEDTVLTSGKRGTKIIEMYRSRKEMPTRLALQTEAKMIEKETGRRTEKIAISPQYLRDFEFDIKLVPNPKAQTSKALERALLMEKIRVYMEFMPDMVDREELGAQLAEAFGDRPEKIFKKEVIAPPPPAGRFPGAGNLGVGENLIKGAIGEEGRGASIRQMIQSAGRAGQYA
ncbi:hypothetical protein DRN43_04645 [Thermococci archaeon]|nr:MAG: hypothetical protein DRN43_04645 [Thermococci archaeon]